MKRRGFLKTGAAATGALLAHTAGAESHEAPASDTEDAQQIWDTLDQVQQHLLPSHPELPPSLTASLLPEQSRIHARAGGKSPGAEEANLLNFLRGVFMDPKMDPANKQLMIDGAKQLQALCMRETGQRFDGRLGHLQKERLLRQFEQDELGGRFLGKMLEYLIEGLLGSPIYGGNRGEVGWQWLNHSPGYPLPPADKKYYEL